MKVATRERIPGTWQAVKDVRCVPEISRLRVGRCGSIGATLEICKVSGYRKVLIF